MLGFRRSIERIFPGLALVAVLTGVAYLVARVPAISVAGPLVTAMFVGGIWRALARPGPRFTDGVAFAARDLLRVGIVLLGVRLDFGLLISVGPAVLLGSALVVGAGVWAIARLAARAGLPSGLGLALAVGTSVCGASAVLAAASTLRMKDEDAGLAIGIISLVGTGGVLLFTLFANLFPPDSHHYGLIVGLTLQEVAQVVAAGYVPGVAAGDVATVAKLARVALLAPALFVMASIGGRGESRGQPRRGRFPVPLFLLGFLAMGVVNGLGWLTPWLARTLQDLSLVLTTMAMVAIGLRFDPSIVGRVAGRALVVGVVGFLGLVVLVVSYLAVVGA